MFPKIGGFPPKSSILIGFSIIFTIHFGVPLFLETPIFYIITKSTLVFSKYIGIPDVCICFNRKLEICRFLRLMQFVL